MTGQAALLIAAFLLTVLICAKPLGKMLAYLIRDEALPGCRGIEKGLFSLCGIRRVGMTFRHYLLAIGLFNALGFGVLMAVLVFQQRLPLNPQHFPGLSWDLAFNTAISFVTNTNWQAYAGETTISYFSSMVGLTVQNFLSAATGMAVLFALIRGFIWHNTAYLGNAWRDLLRITLFILLPIALLMALFFISQGVIQTLQSYLPVTSLEGVTQTLPLGPVASLESIKLLGTNGGGFFNANSAHPFENPTALTNFVQMVLIFLIPAALCFSFGEVTNHSRHARALLWTMSLIFIFAVIAVMVAEVNGNPHFALAGGDSVMNWEGKESRFGLLASSLYTVVTTAASCGAVVAMHDSLTAMGGLVPLWLMQIGEVIFGGVGSGLYGMIINVMLAVFIAGLMIGRTPEYLGKKIGPSEMKMVALYILITPLLVLAGSACALMTEAGRAAITNPGPHGFSEVLYALSSAANNNGSAFAGLSVNTPFWNLLLGIVMVLGRFLPFLPLLIIAGRMAQRPTQPSSSGTLPTQGGLFIGLLIGTIVLTGALTFIPALALGPIAEQMQSIGSH